MTVNRTTLLDLPLPVTGTEDGTWGDVTNNALTQYLDIAVAGALEVTSSVTLATTEGDSSATNIGSTTAQHRTLLVPASGPSGNIVITAPASNRTYHVINLNATHTVQVRAGAGTGVTIGVNQSATVAYNGTDYALVGPIGPVVPVANGGTGITSFGTGVATFLGTPSSANLAAAVTDETGTGSLVFATSPTLVTPVLGTPQSGTLTNATGLPLSTGVTGTLPHGNGGTGQTTYSNGQLLIGKTDGSLAKATLTAGSNVTITNGDGAITIASTGGGGGSPGGSDTQVQFNDGGSFGGDAGLTYNKTTDVLTVSGGAVLQGLTAGRGGGAVASNVAFGSGALNSNTTGTGNVAIGGEGSGGGALKNNTIGSSNIAIGFRSLESNTTGDANTAIGFLAGFNVTTGTKNLSVYAGDGNVGNRLAAGSVGIVTIGTVDQEVFGFTTSISTQLDGLNAGRGAGRLTSNVAFGINALSSNTTGTGNVAIGGEGSGGGALKNNTIGSSNIAIGFRSLENCTTGSSNTSIGFIAGWNVTTGTKNLSVYGGEPASLANRLSAGDVGLISIGTGDAERLRIETTAFKAQLVYDQTTGSAANVFVASDGKMSRSTSSARYKKNIQDAVHGLDKVLQLRPVTFNHINPDEDGIVYGGLIAEEVHDLGLTEFVEYTWDGRPDSLRYGHMVSVLVKAVQELNARVVALETQGA